MTSQGDCCDPTSVTKDEAYGWHIEIHQHCTCGAGGDLPHEPTCGMVPLGPIEGTQA